MRIEGAIFDLDGTLTDSMYIWNEAPKALVRKFGGKPPEDLARDIREMGRREASEYMVDTFCLPCTPEQVMEGVNALVTGEYRDRVPMKTGADTLLERLGALGVPCGIATASEAFQARDAMVRLGLWKHFLFAFSSLVGNYYYTESNFRFIRDSKTGLLVFRLTCVAAIFIGAQMSFSMVWDLADVLMGLMALVNLVAILLLGGKAIRVLRDYQKQRRAGKNPVYRYDEVGVGSPEIWNEAHAKKWED